MPLRVSIWEFFDLPLRSNKLNSTGQFPILLTMVIADQTFWYSSLEALIMQTFVMGFTYFTTQKHHNFTDKLKDMTRNCIRKKKQKLATWVLYLGTTQAMKQDHTLQSSQECCL